jgi:hypothetical protein
MEVINSSESCTVGSNLRPFKSQGESLMSSQCHRRSNLLRLTREMEWGLQFCFLSLLLVQRVKEILPLLVRLRYLRCSNK